MSCESAFEYSASDTDVLVSSTQVVTCKGSVTIPAYSVPGVTMCAWYPSGWGKFNCKWSGKWSKEKLSCNWGVVKWSQSCWTTPSVEIWPSTTMSGSATVSTTTETDKTVTFDVEGPSQSYTTSLTINYVDLTITVGSISITYTIANSVQLAESDGEFSATIALDGFSYEYGGVSASFSNSLLLCPTPAEGESWLSITTDVNFSYDSYSGDAELVCPIAE